MTSITAYKKRVRRVCKTVAPHPKETRLPYLVLASDGSAWPGYEQHNIEHRKLARVWRIPPDSYGFDPNCDGVEP